MTMFSTATVYLITVSCLGVFAMWWLRRHIRTVEDERRKHVEQVQRFEAIRTSSPLEDPAEQARKRALESTATRFSVIRHLLLPILFLIWLIALAYPFMDSIPANMVSLLAAAFTVVVGIAAKPLVENLISGIVISFSQPVRTGDTILIDGNYGTVEDISSIHTKIKIWDWRRYIIPNSLMLQKEFINYTIIDAYQWAYIEFWVAYDSDLTQIRETAVRVARESVHYGGYEEPRFWIMEMDPKGIKCWVAA